MKPDSEADEIHIITPPVADDTDILDFSLVGLTEAINKLNPDAVAHGILGGEFGYGADYENSTFMMHHYCWCEREDCPWCEGEAPNFLHKASGLKIKWYKWIGRSMEVENPKNADIASIFRECMESLK